MRVLVTGGAGLLGRALLASRPAGVEVHATRQRTPVAAEGVTVHACDLADAGATAALVEEVAPDLVIHAAYRKDSGERDIIAATAAVAMACARSVAGLIHLSSDVVFDGEHAPYAEDAVPAPVEPYGAHKLRAEAAARANLPDAAIVRTSLLVQPDPPDPTSRWVIEQLRAGETPRLFVDELRCPTAPSDLAAMLWELTALPADARAGVWHLAGPEAVSRHTLGVLLARRLGLAPRFEAALSCEHPTRRPRDLRLGTARADATLRTPARPIGAVLSA
jgi:dTDP-4-dehydrorhamnose reductase